MQRRDSKKKKLAEVDEFRVKGGGLGLQMYAEDALLDFCKGIDASFSRSDVVPHT
jgi:hypothetical protein